MIWKQFTHLGNFPPELKARFNSFLTTEFDDSLSVEMQLRSVIKWCQGNFKTVDTLIDFINELSNWLKQFETNFDTNLEDSVISVLSKWQANGQLDVVISEALQWQLDNYIITNEQDKDSLDTQLQKTSYNNAFKKINYPTEIKKHLHLFNIYNNNGKYMHDLDIKALKPQRNQTLYVDNMRGNNTNNGLTKATAFKSIWKALEQDGDNEIIVSNGVYEYQDGWKGVNPRKAVNVICSKGEAILTNLAYKRQWTESEEYAGLFTAPSEKNGENIVYSERTKYRFLTDRHDSTSSYGDQIFEQLSLQAMQSGAVGFFIHDASNTLYVRLPLNRDPNQYLKIAYAENNVINTIDDLSNSDIYIEGITAHYGNSSPIILHTSNVNSKIVLVKVKGMNGRSSNGITIKANGVSILYECEASDNFLDGINYNPNFEASGSYVFDGIEINCKGHRNGKPAGGSANNGTTAHSAMRLIRVNGDYSFNQNRNVHDTYGALSFNVGVKSILTETNDADFMISFDSHASGGKMWLIGCEANHVAAQGAGVLYKEQNAHFAIEVGNIQEFIAYEF